MSDIEWTTWAFHTLYWMPDAFEFGAFSLLPMFFAQIIYANEWKSYWSVIKPIYITFMCTICSLQIVWAVMAALNTECFQGGISGMHPVATNHDVLIDESTPTYTPKTPAYSYSYREYMPQRAREESLQVTQGLESSGGGKVDSRLHSLWMAAVDTIATGEKEKGGGKRMKVILPPTVHLRRGGARGQ